MTRLSLIVAISLQSAAAACGQVVQLPSVRQFSTSTTVVVPDRGSISLGGVGRAAGGSNQFGAPGLRGNRSSSAAAQGGGISVSAQIHDFAEIDRQLLERAAAMRGETSGSASRLQQRSGAADVASVSEIERSHAKAQVAAERAARALLQKADDAASAGKYGLAKIYYRMAANREIAPVRELALAGLAKCSTTQQILRK